MPDERREAFAARTALMVRSHHFMIIWLIPIAAILAAGWLGWHSYMSHGPTITISFENAAGIEPGRTPIKYKDTELGVVKNVKLSSDLSHVTITARMSNVATPYLTRGARFWVVKPSLSSRDLSGLGTFISGAYIQFAPSTNPNDKNKPSKHFDGEQSPAIISVDEPGEIYTLHAPQLGSIQQGAPVYFHGAKVGDVLGYSLSDKDGSVTISLFVHAPHNALVHTGTRFWNTSGIGVIVGSAGLRIQLESIQSLLTGGIAFDVPPHSDEGALASAETPFTLYPDESSAQDSVYTRRIYFLLHFADAVPGLTVNAPVRMQGMAVGQVTAVSIEYDQKTGKLIIPVTIEVEADRMKLLPTEQNSENFKEDTYGVFDKLVASGLRAQLGSQNLLTGQKVIDLNVVSGLPRATLIAGGQYPEIPTTNSDDMEAVIRSAKTVMNTANTSLTHLDEAIAGNGETGGDLAGTFNEIKEAARSLRVLTDYLEDHPEAILRGKPKDKDQ